MYKKLLETIKISDLDKTESNIKHIYTLASKNYRGEASLFLGAGISLDTFDELYKKRLNWQGLVEFIFENIKFQMTNVNQNAYKTLHRQLKTLKSAKCDKRVYDRCFYCILMKMIKILDHYSSQIDSFIKEKLVLDDNVKPVGAVNELANFNGVRIFTLNYDNIADRVTTKFREKSPKEIDELMKMKDEKIIFSSSWHGKKGYDDIVLSSNQYDQKYSKGKFSDFFKNYLAGIFLQNTLLFIGCGLSRADTVYKELFNIIDSCTGANSKLGFYNITTELTNDTKFFHNIKLNNHTELSNILRYIFTGEHPLKEVLIEDFGKKKLKVYLWDIIKKNYSSIPNIKPSNIEYYEVGKASESFSKQIIQPYYYETNIISEKVEGSKKSILKKLKEIKEEYSSQKLTFLELQVINIADLENSMLEIIAK